VRTPTLPALLLIALVAGCGDSRRGPAAGAQEAVTAPSQAPSEETAAERRAKREHREPGTVEIAAIDWSSAASMPRVDPSVLPAQSRQAIERATLPVLLPRDEALLASATVTAGPAWYAVALHGDGHHVSIHGTKQMVHQPALAADVPPEQRRAPGETTITRTHGIVTVSFEAFGASYTIDVECDRPMDDVRCTEDAYALSIHDGLGLVGGAQ
jgi:hypothetical protein